MMTNSRRYPGRCGPCSALLGLFLALLGGVAAACPYSIRDAGFIVRDPYPYRLLVLVNDDTPGRDDLAAWVKSAAKDALAESNVVAEALNVDHDLLCCGEPDPTEEGAPVADASAPAPGAPDLRKHVEAVSPAGFPAALLVSPRDTSLLIAQGGPAFQSQQGLVELLRTVVDSPLRRELSSLIIPDWCVLALVPGADAAENERVADTATRAGKAVVGMSTEMDVPVQRPVPLLTLPADDPAERVLRWSLGLDDAVPAQPRLLALFGMLRRVGPIMAAEEVSPSALANLFRLLGRNCTCTSDPTWLLGPAAPLVWGADLQRATREALGFDPNNPAAASALSGVWTTLQLPGEERKPGEYLPEPATGYTEFSVEPGPDQFETENPPPQQEGDAGGDEQASVEGVGLKVVLETGIALGAAALGGSAVLLWRQRRRG